MNKMEDCKDRVKESAMMQIIQNDSSGGSRLKKSRGSHPGGNIGTQL